MDPNDVRLGIIDRQEEIIKYLRISQGNLLYFFLESVNEFCRFIQGYVIELYVTVSFSREYFQNMLLYHFLQIFAHCLVIGRRVSILLYFAMELGSGLRYPFHLDDRNAIDSYTFPPVQVSLPFPVSFLVGSYRYPNQMVQHDGLVDVSGWVNQNTELKNPLKVIKFVPFIKMVQQSRKTIVVTERNFETLRKMGTVTESFNDVITRLIEKAMSGQQPLDWSAGLT
jgi:hypothetical protein